jgi:hypothetical protein
MEEARRGSRPTSQDEVHRRYASERLLEAIRRGANSPEDPKSLEMWARAAGTSRSALGTLCRAVGVSARDARDFTRLYRVFLLVDGNPAELHDVLDIAEPQTVARLFKRAGLPYPTTLSALEFLDHQQLLRNTHVLNALKSAVQQPD